jgi:hypothetical protein
VVPTAELRATPSTSPRTTGWQRDAARTWSRGPPGAPSPPRELALGAELRRLFGQSLKLRQLSAGGCNGCEADVNVLGTVVFDLGRFGIQFVAAPRHADGLLIQRAGHRQYASRVAQDLRRCP